jgi:hypothetical protein
MIAQNAGAEGSIMLAKVRESKDKNFGYNAQTDVYENLVTWGLLTHQGEPDRVAERGLDRQALAHHRVRGGGAEGREAGALGWASGRWYGGMY